MSGDYLFDKSGEPDPEVERLEKLLAPLAYKPKVVPIRRRWPIVLGVLAVAAAIALFFGLRGPRATRVEGDLGAASHLRAGEWLATDRSSRARIHIAELGEVSLDPETRLRVLESGKTHRFELARGTIHAKVNAPPRIFVVDTPSAAAVDLGCAYTMSVDEAGNGVLSVQSGMVSLETASRFAVVPAGASCKSRKKEGPGTPVFDDATDAFKKAVAQFDAGDTSELRIALAEADVHDAITLWHLVFRVPAAQRGEVAERLEGLVPPPVGVTRADAERLDRSKMELWQIAIAITW